MALKIVLIRHGATEATAQWRFSGATDLPLSEEGKEQARRLIGPLSAMRPDLILCSPMRRTVETAKIAMDGSGVGMEIEPLLREADFGEWENMDYSEIRRSYPREAEQWLSGADDFTFPGGESVKGFVDRVTSVTQRIDAASDGTVAAFTHGGVIGQAICRYLDLPSSRHIHFMLPPASITVIMMFEGRGALKAMFDTAYLNGNEPWAQ